MVKYLIINNMRLNENLSVLFWLSKSKKSKNGMVPIYVRMTLHGLRAEFSGGKKIDPVYWDEKNGIPKKECPDYKAISTYLKKTEIEIEKQYNILASIHDVVTVEMLKEALFPKPMEEKGLVAAIKIFISDFEELVNAGKKSPGTLRRYRRTERNVVAFLRTKYKQKDVGLEKVDFYFAEQFYRYLLTKSMNDNTAKQHVKTVKQVVKKAVNLGWSPSSRLTEYKCAYKHPQREFLSMEEIYALYNKPIAVERLSEVRDVFIFCCFTGYAYETVYKLQRANLFKGVDGKLWIRKNRAKTGTEETVPLLPVPLAIIEKYKGHPYCVANDRLLPVNSNQRFNAYLKEIAEICGINKRLTTHMARHTFATTVTLEQDVPIETVSNMLGHKDIRTTQIYAKITKRKVSNNMKELQEKLFLKNGSLKDQDF